MIKSKRDPILVGRTMICRLTCCSCWARKHLKWNRQTVCAFVMLHIILLRCN